MEGLRKDYETRIHQDVANEKFYDKSTKIRHLQRLFQSGDLPVHLRGKNDGRMYRGVMVASIFGIGIAIGTIAMMATNNLTKKER